MAYINVDEVYILDNTGRQVDKTTDLPFRDASLSETEKAQARANIGAGSTNPNLLDNPWFRIDQRSVSGTITSGYIADRWTLTYGSGGVTASRTDDTITVASTTGTSHGDIAQRMEKPLYDYLIGKTITVSLKLNDYSIISRTITQTNTGSSQTLGVDLDGENIYFRFYQTSTYQDFQIWKWRQAGTFRAVKLELGSVSTLANDAPPDYGTELAKCMRYFIRIKGDPIGSGYVTAGLNQAYIHIPTPVPMRTAPTASIDGSVYIRGTGTTWNVSTVTVTGASLQPTNGVAVVATVSATQVMAVSVYMSSASSYIDLSADL